MLANSAYGSGPVRADLKDAELTAVVKPWPLARNGHLGDDQFTRDDFTIDYEEETVTCPNQLTVTITTSGPAVFGAKCRGCPIRDRCTSATNGRTFKIGNHDEFLAQARAQWKEGTGLDDYRQHRPMVERSIAWLVTNGHRRVRYRGVERNRIGLSIRAAEINLPIGWVWALSTLAVIAFGIIGFAGAYAWLTQRGFDMGGPFQRTQRRTIGVVSTHRAWRTTGPGLPVG